MSVRTLWQSQFGKLSHLSVSIKSFSSLVAPLSSDSGRTNGVAAFSEEEAVFVMMRSSYKSVLSGIDRSFHSPSSTPPLHPPPPQSIQNNKGPAWDLVFYHGRNGGGIYSQKCLAAILKRFFHAEDGTLAAERLIGRSLSLEEFDDGYDDTPTPQPVVLPQTGRPEKRCCLATDALGYKIISFVPC